METNLIPTVEEFIKQELKYSGLSVNYDTSEVFTKNDWYNHMIEFAKLHVEAALEAASKNVKIYTDTSGSTDEWTTEIDKNSILNAYPLENIK